MFTKKEGKSLPELETSSLPDIIFMLLFFFMVTTTMRDVSLKVQIRTPDATEIEKLEKKSLVNYIYIGPPLEQYRATFGTAARIQLNDQFARKEDIRAWVELERGKVMEALVPLLTTSIKADKTVKMGIITDVKQELRKANALKLNYSAKRGREE